MTRSTPRPRTSQANTLSDNGTQAVWDWGNVAQAESYFDTADPTQNAVVGDLARLVLRRERRRPRPA